MNIKLFGNGRMKDVRLVAAAAGINWDEAVEQARQKGIKLSLRATSLTRQAETTTTTAYASYNATIEAARVALNDKLGCADALNAEAMEASRGAQSLSKAISKM